MLEKAGPRGKSLLCELGKEMQLAIARGKIISGRHAVFLVIDSFRAFDQSEVHIGLGHMFRLDTQGNDLHNFQLQWESLKSQLPDGHAMGLLLMNPYYRKICKHADLALEIREFDHMPVVDPNKTLDWLEGSTGA